MYTKRLSVIVSLVGLSFLTLFFFVSSQSEHRQRVRKDKELQEVLVKLSDKDAERVEVQRQSAEIETQLKEKIAQLESSVNSLQAANTSLEASLKAQEGDLRSLKETSDKLLKDREALMEDNLEKSENVTIFEKKIADLESSRQELLDKIKSLEDKKTSSLEKPSKKESSTKPLYELRYEAPPALDAAKVGKIIVQKSTGRSAQVQHVNTIYQFVVINAGSRDGLRSGSVINVIREDRIIAKAVVEKLKPDLSAALLLPEWTLEPTQAGDFVTQF